jgi:hypothetical protein
MDLRTPIGLAPLDFSSSAPRDLLVYTKDGHNYNSAMHGVQNAL